LIAAWDFAGLTATTSSTATPATIGATVGSGSLDVSAFGLGSPQGTSPERTAFGGTATVNAFTGGESVTGKALALANSTANGKSMLIAVNTLGFKDIVLTYATQRTSTGFNLQNWSYSTDGGATFSSTFASISSIPTAFGLVSVDFSSVSALDNLNQVLFKLTVNGASSAAGNNRFDNIQFNATAVPEPPTFIAGALLALPFGLQGVRYLRNRKQVS
jgi:hypothetical protein